MMVLPRDHISNQNGPDMWVQEAIFGHRFIEEQKPFMLVLEVLAVCRALQTDSAGELHSDKKIFSQVDFRNDEHESFIIPVPKSLRLRYMLFEETSLDDLQSDSSLTDQEKFDQWVDDLDKGYAARTSKNGKNAFGYLRKRGFGSFKDLHLAVKILRGLEIDILHDRRWTSRFLVPRGPGLLLSDLDNRNFSTDRRFFGRGGEMVYLMLNRSSRAGELGDLILKHFFTGNDQVEQLARQLSTEDDQTEGRKIGYLPLKSHRAYDRLAEDWVSILRLDQLPVPQKFDPLFRLTALNLVRYFSERAQEVMEASRPDEIQPIPLDATGGSNYELFRLSRAYFMRIRDAISDAIKKYIEQELEHEPKWQQALNHHDSKERLNLARDAIEQRFQTSNLSKSRFEPCKPEEWLSYFTDEAVSRHRNNISTLIGPLGKHAGFITARPGMGTWFDGSDEFLEALVLAMVIEPITLGEFAAEIYERYRIVIGPREANEAFSSNTFDISSFENNMRVFEQRLTGLGYVKRLSDDCAFVSNPYYKRKK